jgi:hemerythrin
MPLMSWNPKMSVGVDTFDKDHQKLVALLNDLFDAVSTGKGRDVLGTVLDGLVEYTKFHFSREEEHMTRHSYPDTAAHLREHHDLTRQVVEVQRRWKEGESAVLSMEVLSFLKNWLLKHIQQSDKAYGPFFNAKGVR